MTRLLILLFAFLAALPALANNVPSTKPITPNSACGAFAVGYNHDGDVTEGSTVNETLNQGKRVNAAGNWEWCMMPFDCRSVVNLVPRKGYTMRPRSLPGEYISNRPYTVSAIDSKGVKRGRTIYVCDGKGSPKKVGGWTMIESTLD